MKKTGIFIFFTVFYCLSSLYGADGQRSPISVNLIIDGTTALTGSRGEITAWVSNRLDQILADGDRVTIWNAGPTARVIFSQTISGDSDKEAAKRSIREISASGENADFAGALREAAARQGTGINYTLLICASPAALSPVISGPHSSLLRFSRVEEFSGWRALVVGLNLDTRVRNAASAFMES